MRRVLRIYEIPDETAIFVSFFDNRNEWEKRCRELNKKLFQNEIIGFVAVDDKRKVKIEGDVNKVIELMYDCGYGEVVNA